MAKMSDSQLLAVVLQARDDSLRDQGTWIRESQDFLSYYLGLPLGNEKVGQSSVISNDCEQVVDSNMTSLTAMFLGPEEVMEFTPVDGTPADVMEAEQKTKYTSYLINSQKDSYRIISGWMKDALIQKVSVLKYEYLEEEKVTEKEFDNLSEDDLILLMQDFESSMDDYEVIGQDQDEDGFYLKVRCKRQVQTIDYSKIPIENFVISRNAISKDDAEIVGDMTLVSKGELIAAGYDEDLIKTLPSKETEDEHEKYGIRQIRFRSQGGDDHEDEDVRHWTNEQVQVSDLYVLIDYDDDGIAERRRVVIAGNKILDNDPVDHVPYAILSADLMPDSLIGQSVVEKTKKTQDIKTALYRQMLDNIYKVNSSRVVVNDTDTNLDDLLVDRPNGIVRTRLPNPAAAVAQLQTPYIGDKALQVVQYVDSVRQQTTGGIVANQGLDSDQLQKETATRFIGAEKAATRKIEHIARNFAETGFRELYEGVSWLVSHYYRNKVRFIYKKEPLVVDPRFWRYEHSTRCNVGLAASSEEKTLENLSAMMQTQMMLLQSGSPVVDQKKLYNTLDKIITTMGMHDSSKYINDPEIPQELLMAEIEKLTRENQALAQQSQNMLAEAEAIKQQATTEREILKIQTKAQFDMLKAQQDQTQHDDKMAVDLTKIEADLQKAQINQNVPGSLI